MSNQIIQCLRAICNCFSG